MTMHIWAVIAGALGIALFVWESVVAVMDRHKTARLNVRLLVKIHEAMMDHWTPDGGRALDSFHELNADVRELDEEAQKNLRWHVARATLTLLALLASVILSAVDHS